MSPQVGDSAGAAPRRGAARTLLITVVSIAIGLASCGVAGSAAVKALAPNSCWAGTDDLKKIAKQLATAQAGTFVSLRECGATVLNDQERYVILRVTADYDCDRGKREFGQVFRQVPRSPTSIDEEGSVHFGDWVSQSGTRYYFSCEMGPGYYDVWLSQVAERTLAEIGRQGSAVDGRN